MRKARIGKLFILATASGVLVGGVLGFVSSAMSQLSLPSGELNAPLALFVAGIAAFIGAGSGVIAAVGALAAVFLFDQLGGESTMARSAFFGAGATAGSLVTIMLVFQSPSYEINVPIIVSLSLGAGAYAALSFRLCLRRER